MRMTPCVCGALVCTVESQYLDSLCGELYLKICDIIKWLIAQPYTVPIPRNKIRENVG